jgi:hypothetical protein
VLRGAADAPENFLAFERLGEHVAAAQVENLRPQAVVGSAGSNDDRRSGIAACAGSQHVPPGAVRQVPIGNDYLNRNLAKHGRSLGACSSHVEAPSTLLADAPQNRGILGRGADGQNGQARLRGEIYFRLLPTV